eukprot:350613-Chlamydomonas_euryale.AAC.1
MYPSAHSDSALSTPGWPSVSSVRRSTWVCASGSPPAATAATAAASTGAGAPPPLPLPSMPPSVSSHIAGAMPNACSACSRGEERPQYVTGSTCRSLVRKR